VNRILIIGAGSIGQRHIKALLELGESNIAAFRTNKGNLKIDSKIKNLVFSFFDFSQALAWCPTHIIISNPSSQHYEFILKTIDSGANLFVEKPFLHDYKLIGSNKALISKLRNSTGLVGYNLRFHSLFIEVKNIISKKKFGDVLSSYLHVGHYLPFWHPYEDYQTSYVAKQSMGGGALRTLSHELDLAQYFFGSFNKVFAKIEKLSKLKTNTDDTVNILLENEYCSRITINLNLLDPVIQRHGHIYFEHGLLEYDFIENKIIFTSYKTQKKEIIYEEKEDYNSQYIKQMDHFLNNKEFHGCTFAEGIEVDKLIHYCELSHQQKKELCLD
jgi:predicted dehydrogenase